MDNFNFMGKSLDIGGSGFWNNPSTLMSPACDAVGIHIKVPRGDGKKKHELLIERGLSLSEENSLRTIGKKTKKTATLESEMSPSSKEVGKSGTSTDHKEILRASLQQIFPSMFHAFAFFDVDRRGTITERELTNGIKKLEVDGLSNLSSADIKLIAEELGQKRGQNGLGLSMSAFARYFYFGDDLTDWKEKLLQARHNRFRRRSSESISPLSELINQTKAVEDDSAVHQSEDHNITDDEIKGAIRKALGDDFGGPAGAFAFVDSWHKGSVPTTHLVAIIARSLIKNSQHDCLVPYTAIQSWLRNHEDAGNVSAQLFLSILADRPAGDTEILLMSARRSLAAKVANESRMQAAAIASCDHDWMDKNPTRSDMIIRLHDTFASVADAFFCMAGDSDVALTAPDFAAGIARVGIDPRVARTALGEAGLRLPPDSEDPAAPVIFALEFCAAFTWHELNDWGLAQVDRPHSGPQMPSPSVAAGARGGRDEGLFGNPGVLTPELARALSSTRLVGATTNSNQEPALPWTEEVLQRAASAVNAPRARLDLVCAGKDSLTLVVYPDPDGRRRTETVARDLMGFLANPEGSLASWDPAIFLGCEVSLLLPRVTGWRQDPVGHMPVQRSYMLRSKAATHVRKDLLSRSKAGFSSLGAQAQWEMLDCEAAAVTEVAVSEVSAGSNGRQTSKQLRYRCTVLRHKHGMKLELMHHSFGSFTFKDSEAGRESRSMRCSCEGLISDSQPTEFKLLPILTKEKQSSYHNFSQTSSASQAPNTALCADGSETASQDDGSDAWNRPTSVNAVKQTEINFESTATQYCSIRSRRMGRWSSYLGVPNILIVNECDPNLQLILTPSGFIFMGSGQDGKALIVDQSKPPLQLTLRAARKLLRQVPTMPNDKTELDLCKSKFHELTTQELEVEFDLEHNRQDSRYKMLLDLAFPQYCLCTERLLSLVAIEDGLSVHDKVNRRALSIRLVGGSGQSCIPGTGSSTELAVLISRMKKSVKEKGRSDVVIASFFRSQGHSPVQVISNLVQQLYKHLPAPYPEYPRFSNDYDGLAAGLQQIMLKLILMDKAIILVLDQAHLAEQRVLGKVMSFLRTELQPWLYNIRNHGFVRVVFSGESGFCFPSGIPMATVQLNGLKKESAEKILQQKFSQEGKYIDMSHIRVISQKAEAWRWQYLSIAVEVLKEYWVFEQQTDCCKSLPETLISLYPLLLQRLEISYGVKEIRFILERLVSKRSIATNDLRQHVAESKQSALIIDMGRLLRHPTQYSVFELHDSELEQAIKSRYDEGFQVRLNEEMNLRARQEKLRGEMAVNASVFVLEHNISKKTPCVSLEVAISLAAAGDTIILCKADYTLSKPLLIDRDLTMVTDEGISNARILVHQGQRAVYLDAPKPGCNTTQATESSSFVVTIRGISISQLGFEAEEVPRCVHVGTGAKLVLSNSCVASDQGIGIVVGNGGCMVMVNSCCRCCSIHSILVQKSGHAELQSCELISNAYHEVAEDEKQLHELFVKFCRGTSILPEMAVKAVSIQQKLLLENQMGQRAESLDLNEFMALLAEIKIFPSLMTKTDVADTFRCSLSSHERELDWLGFKNSLYHICKTHSISEIRGVIISEKFKFPSNHLASKKDNKSKWFYSDGLIVDGRGSTVQMIDSYVCGAINGCLVRGGGLLTLKGCRISRSGKSRLDAAGVMVSGHYSRAELFDCAISMSENNGIVVRNGAVCKISTSAIHKTGRQALLATGRGTKVDVTECSISEALGCGILAGKEAAVLVIDSRILCCSDTGVLARFLGTKVILKTCWIDGNGRGVSAENEAIICIDCTENIKDSQEASRKGILEHSAPNKSGGSEIDSASSAPDRPVLDTLDLDSKKDSLSGSKASTQQAKQKSQKPELIKIKSLLASLFQDVAEASIVLDTNAGGTISKSEIERFCARVGVSLNMKALFDEIELSEKGIEEMTVEDFMRCFCWHNKSIFIDGKWKWLLVEAKRSRRRIMNRLYERLKHERPHSAAEGKKSLDHRLSVRFKHHAVSLRESISRTAVDKTELGALVYVRGGRLYHSSKDAMASKNSVTRYASSHGLPGVYKCFDQNRVSAKYLEMNTCTLSRYPRLNRSRDGTETGTENM